MNLFAGSFRVGLEVLFEKVRQFFGTCVVGSAIAPGITRDHDLTWNTGTFGDGIKTEDLILNPSYIGEFSAVNSFYNRPRILELNTLT
ncbi:hypothetical protein N9192_02050, partial [Akkermansiaceae bacterium]|nr:hypothetical protein [Akkermansiaceae bacterium]